MVPTNCLQNLVALKISMSNRKLKTTGFNLVWYNLHCKRCMQVWKLTSLCYRCVCNAIHNAKAAQPLVWMVVQAAQRAQDYLSSTMDWQGSASSAVRVTVTLTAVLVTDTPVSDEKHKYVLVDSQELRFITHQRIHQVSHITINVWMVHLFLVVCIAD